MTPLIREQTLGTKAAITREVVAQEGGQSSTNSAHIYSVCLCIYGVQASRKEETGRWPQTAPEELTCKFNHCYLDWIFLAC
jgi:hypothetical protein